MAGHCDCSFLLGFRKSPGICYHCCREQASHPIGSCPGPAEERASAEGFESVAAYLDALIEDDRTNAVKQDWMHKRIKEGPASPSAGKK
jgi:hypothetical protein